MTRSPRLTVVCHLASLASSCPADRWLLVTTGLGYVLVLCMPTHAIAHRSVATMRFSLVVLTLGPCPPFPAGARDAHRPAYLRKLLGVLHWW